MLHTANLSTPETGLLCVFSIVNGSLTHLSNTTTQTFDVPPESINTHADHKKEGGECKCKVYFGGNDRIGTPPMYPVPNEVHCRLPM